MLCKMHAQRCICTWHSCSKADNFVVEPQIPIAYLQLFVACCFELELVAKLPKVVEEDAVGASDLQIFEYHQYSLLPVLCKDRGKAQDTGQYETTSVHARAGQIKEI